MKGIIFGVCIMGVWGQIAVAAHGPFYQLGKNVAVNSAQMAWDNLGRNCAKIDVFAQIVEDSILNTVRDIQTTYRGRSARQFGAGYRDGLSSVLDTVGEKCRHNKKAKVHLGEAKQLLADNFQDRPISESNSYAYRIGYNSGSQLARMVWDNLPGDCQEKTPLFVELVGENMGEVVADIGTTYTGRAAEHFAQGYLDGLVGVSGGLTEQCPKKCGSFGSVMGQSSGNLFCPIADKSKNTKEVPKLTSKIANMGGERCGNDYRSRCQSEFVSVVEKKCPKYLGLDSFEDYYGSNNKSFCASSPPQ